MIRSCSLINTQVVGGFDRLTKHFIDEYKPEVLISYVDRRYFNGHGYKNWELVNKTSPNYWYIKDLNVYNRMGFQKHKLKNILEKFDFNKTEYENMLENNYLRIWDCGNLKFKYN